MRAAGRFILKRKLDEAIIPSTPPLPTTTATSRPKLQGHYEYRFTDLPLELRRHICALSYDRVIVDWTLVADPPIGGRATAFRMPSILIASKGAVLGRYWNNWRELWSQSCYRAMMNRIFKLRTDSPGMDGLRFAAHNLIMPQLEQMRHTVGNPAGTVVDGVQVNHPLEHIVTQLFSTLFDEHIILFVRCTFMEDRVDALEWLAQINLISAATRVIQTPSAPHMTLMHYAATCGAERIFDYLLENPHIWAIEPLATEATYRHTIDSLFECCGNGGSVYIFTRLVSLFAVPDNTDHFVWSTDLLGYFPNGPEGARAVRRALSYKQQIDSGPVGKIQSRPLSIGAAKAAVLAIHSIVWNRACLCSNVALIRFLHEQRGYRPKSARMERVSAVLTETTVFPFIQHQIFDKVDPRYRLTPWSQKMSDSIQYLYGSMPQLFHEDAACTIPAYFARSFLEAAIDHKMPHFTDWLLTETTMARDGLMSNSLIERALRARDPAIIKSIVRFLKDQTLHQRPTDCSIGARPNGDVIAPCALRALWQLDLIDEIKFLFEHGYAVATPTDYMSATLHRRLDLLPVLDRTLARHIIPNDSADELAAIPRSGEDILNLHDRGYLRCTRRHLSIRAKLGDVDFVRGFYERFPDERDLPRNMRKEIDTLYYDHLTVRRDGLSCHQYDADIITRTGRKCLRPVVLKQNGSNLIASKESVWLHSRLNASHECIGRRLYEVMKVADTIACERRRTVARVKKEVHASLKPVPRAGGGDDDGDDDSSSSSMPSE